MNEEQKVARINWHPAFFDAIRAELADYREVLDFHQEYPLNAEPLRIDVLVIKKYNDYVIEKNIGRIFRQINLIEYKSPEDTLTVEDFYKIGCYTCGFRVLHKEPEITAMSASFVVRSHPCKLIRHLDEVLGLGVVEESAGIYVVSGCVVPTQIIESDKLPEKENLWLCSLTGGLNREHLDNVLRQRKLQRKSIGGMGAYIDALLDANQDITKKELNDMHPEIVEVIESVGLGDKWRQQGYDDGRQQGRDEGIEQGKLDTARAMFLKGYDFDEISHITGFPLDRLQKELHRQ